MKTKASILDRIERLIGRREAARQNSDWAKADSIRAELLRAGVKLIDKPGQTVWVQAEPAVD